MIIDTADQYLAYASQVQPIVLTGKKRIRINVPCANTILVRRDLVVANNYNPNHVSDDKMELRRPRVVCGGGRVSPVHHHWA